MIAIASIAPNEVSIRVGWRQDSCERLHGSPSETGTRLPKHPTGLARKAALPRRTLSGKLPKQVRRDYHPVQQRRRLLRGGKSIAYLVTKTGPDKEKDAIQIFLCPKSFLDQMGIAFKPDEAIEVKGSKVKYDGADLILARELVKGGDTLIFRFPDGKPAW